MKSIRSLLLFVLELILLYIIGYGILAEYSAFAGDLGRYQFESTVWRITIDVLLCGTLLFRIATLLLKQFSRQKIKHNNRILLILVITYTILIAPDIFSYLRWNYYADMWGFKAIIYLIPSLFWTSLIITKRLTSTKKKMGVKAKAN